MKIFLGNPMTCNLNYQPYYIYKEIKNNYEITETPEEADIIIFPGTCACSIKDIFITSKKGRCQNLSYRMFVKKIYKKRIITNRRVFKW